MKFCQTCGSEISDDARFCKVCGTIIMQNNNNNQYVNNVNNNQRANTVNNPYMNPQYEIYQNVTPYQQNVTPNGIEIAAFILMILATIVFGVLIIPLAWCVPMTVIYYNKINRNEIVGVGFKICVLMFCGLIGFNVFGVVAGILMLCDDKC